MTRKVTRPPVCHVLTTSGGWDCCSPDETLRRGEEVAQALVVPCSGLHAHHPARSHRGTPWAQPRPLVHCTGCKPHRVGEGHGSHRHTWTPRHRKVRAVTHKGTLTAGRQGLWLCTGASRMHKGVCPRKRNRWSSQTQTRVSWHHDFRHTTPQRTSKPSVTGLLDSQPLSNDTLPQT